MHMQRRTVLVNRRLNVLKVPNAPVISIVADRKTPKCHRSRVGFPVASTPRLVPGSIAGAAASPFWAAP
jgi:hypothetical protein